METKTLLAGWAKEDITPPKRVLLQGQYYERISEGVNDRLFASVAAFERGDHKDYCVMIALDLIGVENIILNRLREALENEPDAPGGSKILIWGIHNHTGPLVKDDNIERLNWNKWRGLDQETYMNPSGYLDFLIDKLKGAVLKAWREKEEVKVGRALGHAVVGHPRRVLYDDRSAMYGAVDSANFTGLESGSDHGVELMYFFDMKDRLKGAMVNVACPAQVIEHMSVISADYFGVVRRLTEEKFGKDFILLPQISAAGDQSPRDLIRRGKSETIMNDPEGMEELGRRVSEAVFKGYGPAKENATGKLVFAHGVKEVLLPLRTVSKSEVEKAEEDYSNLMANYSSEKDLTGKDLINLSNIRAVLNRKEVQERACFYSFEMHVLRIGDCAIVTNPFELYIDYGFVIKARSKALQTFIIQLCCGSGAYLPTQKSIEGGSYGANVANGVTGPDGGRLYVLHAISEINKLFGDLGSTTVWKF